MSNFIILENKLNFQNTAAYISL